MAKGDTWRDWQRPYLPGTFVLWPPDELRVRVNTLRSWYDPESQRICDAHVTVTQPLLRAPTDDDWRVLELVVEDHAAFDVEVGPVGSFLPHPCIWLGINPAYRVLALRGALHATGLFNLRIPHPENFTPHMTITEGLSGAPVDRALFEQLRDSVESGSFHCASLAYIVPDDDFHFVVARTLPLRPSGD